MTQQAGANVSRETLRIFPWAPKPEQTLWGPYRAELTLLDILKVAHTRACHKVMLTGPVPPREWFLQDATPWQAIRVLPDHETPAARYNWQGVEVEIRHAGEWFGTGDYYSHGQAQAAWGMVEHALTRSGRGGAAMFRSPGATGIDLWLRTMGGVVPAPIDDDVQQLIRSTTPQHRIELMAPQQADMPAVWVLDGRWMYAALTRELGVGPAHMLTGEQATARAVDPYARGRYLVDFTAPDWWADTKLPGMILSTQGDNPGDGWHAPLSGRAWVDASELLLARRYDWQCIIREGIALATARPLDTWTARLIRARESIEPDEVGTLARAAIRSVMLHAIGSFHATGRQEQTVTSSPMIMPDGDGWEPPTMTQDGRAIWRRDAPAPSTRQQQLRHPELSAAVWGRAHTRILESTTASGTRSGALATKAGTLVSIYGDAIMTTALPAWARDPDDGKPGRLRVKGHLCGPHPWPTSARERDEITRAASAAGTECTKGCE